MRAWPWLVIVGVVAGCSELPPGLEAFEGSFSYMAADGIGRPAFGGTLRLNVNADSSVSGTHDSAAYRSGGGTGQVVGRVTGDSIFLWLDPNPDGGIIFHGRRTIGGFSGTWDSNTIAGPIPGGSFFAQRSNDLLPSAP